MTWKYFFNSLLEMFGAVAIAVCFTAWVFGTAWALERLLQALYRKARKANTSPPAPLPDRRGEGGSGRGEGDDHDLDGGVGGAPVCP